MEEQALWQSIVAGLPTYLDRQRWFADKQRSISAISIVDNAVVESSSGGILLSIVGIEFENGDIRRYFVPMTVHAEATPEHFTIATVENESGPRWIQDALPDARFRDFLVDAGRGATLAGRHGKFVFEPWLLDGAPFQLEPGTASVAISLEQSNSSIAYGTQAMAKVYRRLEVGQHIEVDMNRFLASDAGFDSVPQLIGAATYTGPDGDVPLVLVQQHVGKHRDGWTALTEQLRHQDPSSLDFIEALGTVTGRMHVALAGAPERSPLAPVPISESDTRDWQVQFIRAAEDTDRMVREQIGGLPDRSERAARNFIERSYNWTERARRYELLAGSFKTRVHGDYHLGQVLVTPNNRIFIVDFEGEPQRPAHEREAKYSPLKDVAGMLRSLNYATGFIAGSPGAEANADSLAWLANWEHEARQRFLDAYRASISAARVQIAPTGNESFLGLLDVMESDKALYEVRYELSSRPDWAWLPLDSFT